MVLGQLQGDPQHARAIEPIQAVPSACSSCPPVGKPVVSGRNTPRLSMPGTAPLKTLRPSGSLAIEAPAR